jgi:hypothetical protein
VNIESCNTWQCINSFGIWISAFGTILISGVSLWLSIKDKLVQLDVRFGVADFPIDDPRIAQRWAYSIDFVNLGPRPVTVTSLEWRLRSHPLGRPRRLFISPYGETGLQGFCTKLPCEITDGKKGEIFYGIDTFKSIENSCDFLFADNYILAFYRISTFQVFICTSIGKKVRAKTNRGIRRYIWRQYKEYKKCEIDQGTN